MTNNRAFQYPEKYPEEQSDFQIPTAYTHHTHPDAKRPDSDTSPAPPTELESPPMEQVVYPDPEPVLERSTLKVGVRIYRTLGRFR